MFTDLSTSKLKLSDPYDTFNYLSSVLAVNPEEELVKREFDKPG